MPGVRRAGHDRDAAVDAMTVGQTRRTVQREGVVMKRFARSFVAAFLVIALTGSFGASTSASGGIVPSLGEPTLASLTSPTLAQLVGQKLVVRMSGTTPTADLLGRIQRGEIGGVILFGSNVTTHTALIALTGKLRAAAAAGG